MDGWLKAFRFFLLTESLKPNYYDVQKLLSQEKNSPLFVLTFSNLPKSQNGIIDTEDTWTSVHAKKNISGQIVEVYFFSISWTFGRLGPTVRNVTKFCEIFKKFDKINPKQSCFETPQQKARENPTPRLFRLTYTIYDFSEKRAGYINHKHGKWIDTMKIVSTDKGEITE